MSKKISLTIAFLLTIILSLWIYFYSTYPTTSPLNSAAYFVQNISQPRRQMKKQVLGFLPFWRLDDIQYIRHDLVSEINYFSLYLDEQGNIIKQNDPGWQNWQRSEIKDLIAKTQILGGYFSLSISAHDNNTIEKILSSTNSRQNVIKNIINETKTNNLNAINIDFEYLGSPDPSLKNKFTRLMTDLSSVIKSQTPSTQLYISLPPLAARGATLFDIKNLNKFTDQFIGMSYDYYGPSSDIAGPTAPMTGFSQNKYFFDISSTYSDFTKNITASKIIMGIPYYGWDWAVQKGSQIQSPTFPSSHPSNYTAVISYARARNNKNLTHCQWDEYALQPWCYYTDEKNIDHQVWFENTKSINEKFNYSVKQNFSGIAIWTIGFDKSYPDLWQLIKTKFTK